MCGPVFGSHIAFLGRFWRVKKVFGVSGCVPVACGNLWKFV